MERIPSKILLFGEYSLLEGSYALSIPFSGFSGKLCLANAKKTKEQNHSNLILKQFSEFIESKSFAFLDMEKLKNDISKGLYFDSSIPVGQGLGSSGALVAAFLKEYASPLLLKSINIMELKGVLSDLEEFFHGKSSGIDPLTSYLNAPVKVLGGNNIFVDDEKTLEYLTDFNFFLLKTGIRRNTKVLVRRFKQRLLDTHYNRMLKEEYMPLVSESISLFITGSYLLHKCFKELSRLQMSFFDDMIPPEIKKLFSLGLEKDSYYLKLCGAGGGGYFVGATKNRDLIEKYIPCEELVWLNK